MHCRTKIFCGFGMRSRVHSFSTLLVDLPCTHRFTTTCMECICFENVRQAVTGLRNFSIGTLHCHLWPHWRELNTGGAVYLEMLKWGSFPQREVKNGFNEGFAIHTTQQCQQWEGIPCSGENLRSQSELANNTICAHMALTFNVDRCCNGAGCVDDRVLQQAKKAIYTYNRAHSFKQQWQTRGAKKILRI